MLIREIRIIRLILHSYFYLKNTNLPLFVAFCKFYWSNIQLLSEVLHYTKKSPTVLILTSTLDLLQRRDASAQRKVYEQYSNTLYWTAFRYVRERMVAKDIVVEAFMKIFEAVTNVKFESLRNFEAWMKRIVINESLSYLRKHANFRMMPETEASEEPIEDHTLEKISAEEIHALIAKLPDGYRTVFNLYVVEGYTHREIGEMLGISEGTSKSQLNHARKLLQKKILMLDSDAARRFLS